MRLRWGPPRERMKQRASTPFVKTIMTEFARLTGLSPESSAPRRYQWTDAFSVCNLLGLYQETGGEEFKDLALGQESGVKSLSWTWPHPLLQPFDPCRQIPVILLKCRESLPHHTHRARVNAHPFPDLTPMSAFYSLIPLDSK